MFRKSLEGSMMVDVERINGMRLEDSCNVINCADQLRPGVQTFTELYLHATSTSSVEQMLTISLVFLLFSASCAMWADLRFVIKRTSGPVTLCHLLLPFIEARSRIAAIS